MLSAPRERALLIYVLNGWVGPKNLPAILFIAGISTVGLAIAPLDHRNAASVFARKLRSVAAGEGHHG